MTKRSCRSKKLMSKPSGKIIMAIEITDLTVMNKKLGKYLLVLLNSLAVIFAVWGVLILTDYLYIYNLIRALIFTYLNIVLFLKPHKVDFLSSLKRNMQSNYSESNIKVALVICYVLSFSNALISITLFFN